MSDQQSLGATQPNRDSTEDEISLLELLTILAERKKLIIGLPLLFAICAALGSLLLPNIFKATARILPPQQSQSGATAVLNQLGGLANMAGASLGIKNPNDLYVGMLKSRSVADNLIQRFNLKSVYEEKDLEGARKTLAANSTIVSGKDGIIAIDVEDKDAKLAATLSNAYVDELAKLNNRLSITEASRRRLFYEQQLQIAKTKLAETEATLKGTLDSKGMISVDSETRTIVETTARLHAEISAKQIEISTMQAFVTSNNPEYRRAEQELRSMRAQLTKLENGNSPSNFSDKQGTEKGGLANIMVVRDLKYYQTLYEILIKQYEAARLDEANDASIIQVLDQAIVPERKAKPKRAVIVVIFTLIGLVIAITYTLVLNAIRKNWNSLPPN
ncbi:MAG TPA: Wzz/FepE/Etk N-terminal domain-containing protein [Burkholderiaceae bacterium]|nr:Wzz/FepE/Etk N-terminal domain-containing protein [Burkholderiaceae bacterium]